MAKEVIRVEALSKEYRLGVINATSLLECFKRKESKYYKEKNITPGAEKIFNRSTFLALDEVNFSINEGDTVGVIGNNGAGKSTLLKILSRITAPTRGKVFLKGKVSSLLEIGTGFHQDLTGKENIFLNGSILGMKSREIKSKLEEIISFSGVEKFIDTPVKRYSSGMYVRLAFSVAAHLDSDILLMDEVLAVGDAEFQKKCLGKMDEVSKKGRTVLFVSHNMEAVRSLCAKTLLLEQGKLVSYDLTPEVIELRLKREQSNRTVVQLDEKGTEVDLTRLEIMNEEGLQNNNFSFTQSPTIRFDITIKALSERAVISFGLVNRFGNRVFTNDYKLIDLFQSTGAHSLYIEIPSCLFTPGQYMIAFGVHIPNQDFIYVLDEKLYIHYYNADSDRFVYHHDDGSIIVPCKWTAR